MNPESETSVGRCGFCEQGHLHVFRCPRCSAVVAVCDECELVWDDVAAVHADPALPSDSAFPLCPRCGSREGNWAGHSLPPTRKVQRNPDDKLYGLRYMVDCFFHRLKRFRAIAMRFEKTAINFLAVAHIAWMTKWIN